MPSEAHATRSDGNRRRRRIWIALLLLVVVAAGSMTAWLLAQNQEQPETVSQVVTVEPTTLKSTVTATGTLQPKRQANLVFPSSGTVTSVKVSVGQQVEKGQALATMDNTSLSLTLASARADLDAAEEELNSLQDSDASSSAIASAKATVKVKRNAVEQASNNLDSATITAPFSGLVAEVNVAEGESTGATTQSATSGGANQSMGAGSVGANSNTSSAASDAAVVLISPDEYEVSASVSSADIAKVKQGLQVEMKVGESTDKVYGTVSSVAVVATTSTSGTSTFSITIDVTGKKQGLFAGSSVTADIIVSQYPNVIAVSPLAVTTKDGKSTVDKIVNGVATPTEVSTAETIDGQVIIKEGLAEGDQISVQMPTIQIGNGNGNDEGNRFPTDGMPNGFPGGEPPAGFEPPSGGRGGAQQGPDR